MIFEYICIYTHILKTLFVHIINIIIPIYTEEERKDMKFLQLTFG